MRDWKTGEPSTVAARRREPGRRVVGPHRAALVIGLLALPASIETSAMAEPPPLGSGEKPPVAKPAEPQPPVAKLAATPPPDRPKSAETAGPVVTFTGLGVGVVGIVAGSIAGALSLSKTSDLKDACPGNVCPMSRQSDIDSAKTLASLSNAAFVVGATGLAVAITGLVLWHDEAKAAAGAQARAVIGPGTISLQGRF